MFKKLSVQHIYNFGKKFFNKTEHFTWEKNTAIKKTTQCKVIVVWQHNRWDTVRNILSWLKWLIDEIMKSIFRKLYKYWFYIA